MVELIDCLISTKTKFKFLRSTFPVLEISPADEPYLDSLFGKAGQVEGYFCQEC